MQALVALLDTSFALMVIDFSDRSTTATRLKCCNLTTTYPTIPKLFWSGFELNTSISDCEANAMSNTLLPPRSKLLRVEGDVWHTPHTRGRSTLGESIFAEKLLSGQCWSWLLLYLPPLPFPNHNVLNECIFRSTRSPGQILFELTETSSWAYCCINCCKSHLTSLWLGI